MLKTIIKGSMIVGALAMSFTTLAGNEDRIGSAGASEMLVNPWARSTAFGTAGVASTNGLEAQFTNIAGLAFTEKTQIKFNYTNWLGDADISLNSAGIAQRVGDQTVIALSLQAFGYGDIDITTVDLPEGGIGEFSPRKNIINIGFAREFSNSIYAGLNVKVMNENISNLKATGVAFDAGIRYVTGEQDQMKFGITLKNVGTPMTFEGDGTSQEILYQGTGGNATLVQRSATFEMPSLLAMGFSYDFIFDESKKLIVAAAFHANSFTNDQFNIGLDYGMAFKKAAFNVRAGFVGEKAIFDREESTTSLTGLTAGVSIDALLGDKAIPFGFEYAIRTSNPFGVINTFGVTLSLK
ncbi:PorV/PorQ family protein [Brumimicrobium mesophilum]|uniref:PorV/PorQ family protein n=1 Tax=Brumimicrobium mesophilum TaxID=392717 RepID=UPI00131C82FB|nr:PorV/PorQ family protein [Brumimicrobium mesophilum]